MHPWSPNPGLPRLPRRPQLKPWFRRADTGEALVLEHAQSALVFEGRAARGLLPSLLPLLDGTRTPEQLAAELGAAGRAVEPALRLLAERRLLLDGPCLDPAEAAAVVETAELLASLAPDATPAGVRASLAAARVDVAGAGGAAAPLADVLRASGVGGVRRPRWEDLATDASGLVVAVPARDEAPAVEAWNRRALARRQCWLQLLPFDGRFAAVGPLYVPGETCCFECYRLRRRAASGYPTEFGAVEAAPVAASAGPALSTAQAGIGAAVVLRWLANGDTRLPGVLYAYEAPGTALTEHRVYRVPRCPACSGTSDVAPPLPWYKETRLVATAEAR
jgi:bacteriocin biosynthesis cyclodehydratase domain-containing protein